MKEILLSILYGVLIGASFAVGFTIMFLLLDRIYIKMRHYWNWK